MVLDKLSEGKAMGEYRKKPVVIEAVKFDGTIESILPLFKVSAVPENIDLVPSGNLEIQTLEGVMTASIGDWIIRGVKGELYPCKPEIFAATYEVALTAPPAVAAEGERKDRVADISAAFNRNDTAFKNNAQFYVRDLLAEIETLRSNIDELQGRSSPALPPARGPGDPFADGLLRLEQIRAAYRAKHDADVAFLLSFVDELWREYSRTLMRADATPSPQAAQGEARDAERYHQLRREGVNGIKGDRLDASVDLSLANYKLLSATPPAAATEQRTIEVPPTARLCSDCNCMRDDAGTGRGGALCKCGSFRYPVASPYPQPAQRMERELLKAKIVADPDPEPSCEAGGAQPAQGREEELASMFDEAELEAPPNVVGVVLTNEEAKEIASILRSADGMRERLEAAESAAKRWHALRNCARITAMGSAGCQPGTPSFESPDAHVTLNFWTHHQARETEAWHREWLDTFVDKAVAALPAAPTAGEEG